MNLILLRLNRMSVFDSVRAFGGIVSGAVGVALKATDGALQVADQAVTATTNIAKSGVGATRNIAVSGLGAAGKLGSTALNTTGKTGSLAIVTTGRVANAALNTTAVLAESTAAATQQVGKETLKQAGEVSTSAVYLLGSATSTVTDMFGSLARDLGERSRVAKAKSGARNELLAQTSQHFKDALIGEYTKILGNNVNQFTQLFKKYNESFKTYIKSYKDMNCAKGYLWGHRCNNTQIKENIKGFKNRVKGIGAKFTSNLNEVSTTVMRYAVKINGLNKASNEELMAEAKSLTESNFNTFTARIEGITQAFDKLFEDMSRSSDDPVVTSQPAPPPVSQPAPQPALQLPVPSMNISQPPGYSINPQPPMNMSQPPGHSINPLPPISTQGGRSRRRRRRSTRRKNLKSKRRPRKA